MNTLPISHNQPFIFCVGNQYYRAKFLHSNSNNNEDVVVEFYPSSGGFVRTVPFDIFNADEKVTIVDEIPTDMKHGWVTIDGSRPVLAYYDDNNRWNGWLQPLFTLDVCNEVIKHYYDSDEEPSRIIKRVDGGFEVVDSSYDEHEPDVYVLNDTELTWLDSTITVNPISDGWCWTECETDDAIALLYLYNLQEQDPNGFHTYTEDTPPSPSLHNLALEKAIVDFTGDSFGEVDKGALEMAISKHINNFGYVFS